LSSYIRGFFEEELITYLPGSSW